MLFNPYIWGDGGGEPTENETTKAGGYVTSLITALNTLVGGTEYEPQSE